MCYSKISYVFKGNIVPRYCEPFGHITAPMTTNSWRTRKKVKNTTIWSKKTCPSYESYFANKKKLWRHWFDFKSSFVQSTRSWNDEERKRLFSYKVRNHATMTFWKSFNFFFKEIFYRKPLNLSNLKTAVLTLSTRTKTTIYCTQTIYVVMTNKCLSRGVLNKYTYCVGLLDSPSKFLNMSHWGHAKKNYF